MTKFCKCCGQALPGTEASATLFNGKLTIRLDGLYWDGNHCRLTKTQSYVCLAMARTYPRPMSMDFAMDYLENIPDLGFSSDNGKIIDVFLCKIRKAMLDAGCPFHIETTWGLGKQFVEGAAPGRVISASSYPRDSWKEAKHAR
jgi:hypothetical protein